MIIYSANIKQFNQDVLSNMIALKIERQFYEKGMSHSNTAEFASWKNSMKMMQRVLEVSEFAEDIQIAIEYQIPLTSKRVDFMIAGLNEKEEEHVVVIELKQWEDAHKTTTNGVVKTFTGGSLKAVAHPSYQAYTYAKLIENYNSTVQDNAIGIHPCAYLHNYKKDLIEELIAPVYEEILGFAPVYIKDEEKKLRDFIKKYVTKASKRDLLYEIDNGKIRPSKSLQDTIVNMISGNKEFIMIDEQKVVYEAIKNLVDKAQKDDKKYTIIVEGGPGTGKSVVAIQLLVDLISNKNLVVNYVTKNAAPRNVYFEKLKQGRSLNNYVKNLFKGSGTFTECESNVFDCLIVDEAHRLNAKSGIFRNKGENQVKEIINASKVSVFFIDEDQIVTASDIGSICEIKKWANQLGSKVYCGEQYQLSSQFRCNGSDGYIAFIDDLLDIRKTANSDGFDLEYELKVYNDPNEMREALREKNKEKNKARMLAGYCYEWISKSNLEAYDIVLDNGFMAKWNFATTSTWAIDEDSFEQVGCIHTSQGLEFDYVGIIIGEDLKYEDGHVVTDPNKRARTDQSLRGLKTRIDRDEIADKIIRNTYKTLLTRGQRGCYIYCQDKNLQDYLRRRIYKNTTA